MYSNEKSISSRGSRYCPPSYRGIRVRFIPLYMLLFNCLFVLTPLPRILYVGERDSIKMMTQQQQQLYLHDNNVNSIHHPTLSILLLILYLDENDSISYSTCPSCCRRGWRHCWRLCGIQGGESPHSIGMCMYLSLPPPPEVHGCPRGREAPAGFKNFLGRVV